MDLLQLRYFLKLAELQHVSRAAEELYISQPALSATIKKLEKELGVPLFLRQGRNIVLSHYGEVYKTHVEEGLLTLDNGRRALDILRGADDCKLELGLLSPYIWTEVFQEFAALYPEVTVNRYSVEGDRFIDSLISGKIDLYLGGINRIASTDRQKIRYITLYEDEMVLLVHASHPLAGKKEIDLRQCRDERFINLEAGTNLQQFIDHMFEQAGFTPKVVMTCDYTLRDQITAEGHGVSITTQLSAKKSGVTGVVHIPITFPGEKRKLGLVWHKNRLFSSSMEKFCGVAKRFYSVAGRL